MKEIKIRKARKKDFNELYELQKEFSKVYRNLSRYKIKALSKEEFKKEFYKRFGRNKYFFVAQINDKIVGYVFGFIEKDAYGSRGYIEDIFVTKDAQGKGIASMLKDKFLEILKKKKVKYCRIDVNPENKKAIKVYQRWGFKIDKYRMSLKLE
jgi:ribosomal protein S18 acetylase RimI-like enzyme